MNFFSSESENSTIPEDFLEVHLCMALGCTYTELQEFPAEFILKSVVYLKQQSVAEKIKQSTQEAKSKHKTLGR